MSLPNYNIFTGHKFTSRLREIRNTALAEINRLELAKAYITIDSVTIHFFSDCCLVSGKYRKGIFQCKPNEMLTGSV